MSSQFLVGLLCVLCVLQMAAITFWLTTTRRILRSHSEELQKAIILLFGQARKYVELNKELDDYSDIDTVYPNVHLDGHGNHIID